MADEKMRLLGALGTTRHPELQKRLIARAFSDRIRKQDKFRPLHIIGHSTPAGRRALWDTVQERIDKLADELGGSVLMSYTLKVSCEILFFVCI